ncbi:MAG: acetaldehyde dehydrogenase (acetylating) [Bacilli bacterium]|jgi:acetaldehyde dehydrogenase|nr:acetaldehyde dehydrogenase (acetylating) [Bacilli bacterium]
MKKLRCAILGPGNIGSDLMYKIDRSDYLELVLMAGIVESEGIKRARDKGIATTIEGVDGIIKEKDHIDVVFDATSAAAHLVSGPKLNEVGIFCFDLTPAALGPYMVPSVNLDDLKNELDVNLVTCGGQATIPIVYACSLVGSIKYAEIIASISSKSAGPGTRANIDEFTQTTANALKVVGQAKTSRAIIILNPADPPVLMANTIHIIYDDENIKTEDVLNSVEKMVKKIQHYVPGYTLKVPPFKNKDHYTMIIEVKGRGDFLPVYSGNLDIINSAAVEAAEKLAVMRGE